MISAHEAAQELRAAMARAGIVTQDEILADGRIHRCHAEADKAKSKNAWYVLHLGPRPMGRFGSWRLGISRGWASRHIAELSPEQLAESEHQIERATAAREKEQARREARAARRAAYIWEHAAPAIEKHAYLKAKAVGPHGLREHAGALVVPMYDAQGVLWSLQFIGPDGAKRFLAGGRVIGCFCTLKPVEVSAYKLKRLYLAEGFATGATVQEVTGETVLIAFNAGNLRAVAEAVRARLPGVAMVIAADNDQWTKGNPGLDKAFEAAAAVGGGLAVPWSDGLPGKPTDWNDLYRLRGAAEVRARLARLV